MAYTLEKGLEGVEVIHALDMTVNDEEEVFGNDENHDALAVVGMVPGLIFLIFCGVFALTAAFILVDFKLYHPSVHNMGDAGYILFAPLKMGASGRELLGAGTLFFAITAVGACALLGEFALATLSDFKLCNMIYAGISSAAVLAYSLPRALNWGLG